MEHTDGLGRKAEVWFGGTLMTVCDGVSSAAARCAPGELGSVKFSYPAFCGFSWPEAVRNNRSEKVVIEPVSKWCYVGYGRVVQVMPVVVDFGMVQMEDPNWSDDESLVGRFVRIPIDRLDLVPDDAPDWPDGV